MNKNWDWGGIGISIGCLFHCILLPSLLSNLSVLGINLLDNHYIESLLIISAGIIGYISLSKGKKIHHKNMPSLLFILGFIILVVKNFINSHHLLFSIIAFIAIFIAHTYNYMLLYKKPCSSSCPNV